MAVKRNFSRPIQPNPWGEFVNDLPEFGLENIGSWYSIYKAIVVSNDDPENLQRLQLWIPQVAEDPYDYWAFPRNVYYGEGYGVQNLPKVGDTVWVEFEGGAPEVPVWSHGHPARKEMPKGDEDLKDKDCVWFVTKKGHKIKINDTKNTIEIYHSLGHGVLLNDRGFSVLKGKTQSVSLGKKDKSTYKAVLGEPLQEILNNLISQNRTLYTAISSDAASTGNTPYLGKASITAAIASLIESNEKLVTSLNKILSNLVTLE